MYQVFRQINNGMIRRFGGTKNDVEKDAISRANKQLITDGKTPKYQTKNNPKTITKNGKILPN